MAGRDIQRDRRRRGSRHAGTLHLPFGVLAAQQKVFSLLHGSVTSCGGSKMSTSWADRIQAQRAELEASLAEQDEGSSESEEDDYQ